MNDGFDDVKVLSQVQEEIESRVPVLNAQQRAIYENLKSIGEEIAAYYLDGIRILQYKDLETAASLLAHVAREIDGGLRDILEGNIEKEPEFTIIHTPDGETLQFKKRKKPFEFEVKTPGTVKLTYKSSTGGHKLSILQSLDMDESSPLAERWIKVTDNFYGFAHRHGAWKPPRRREEFQNIWYEFESLLADLVGSFY